MRAGAHNVGWVELRETYQQMITKDGAPIPASTAVVNSSRLGNLRRFHQRLRSCRAGPVDMTTVAIQIAFVGE